MEVDGSEAGDEPEVSEVGRLEGELEEKNRQLERLAARLADLMAKGVGLGETPARSSAADVQAGCQRVHEATDVVLHLVQRRRTAALRAVQDLELQRDQAGEERDELCISLRSDKPGAKRLAPKSEIIALLQRRVNSAKEHTAWHESKVRNLQQQIEMMKNNQHLSMAYVKAGSDEGGGDNETSMATAMGQIQEAHGALDDRLLALSKRRAGAELSRSQCETMTREVEQRREATRVSCVGSSDAEGQPRREAKSSIISLLKRRLDDLRAENQKAGQRLDALQEGMLDATATIDSLTSERDTLAAECEELKAQVRTSDNRLTDALAAETAATASAQQELAHNWHGQLMAKEEELRAAQSQMRAHARELEDCKRNAAQQEQLDTARCGHLQRELDAAHSERRSLVEELRVSQQTAQRYCDDILLLQRENRDLNVEMSGIRDDFDVKFKEMQQQRTSAVRRAKQEEAEKGKRRVEDLRLEFEERFADQDRQLRRTQDQLQAAQQQVRAAQIAPTAATVVVDPVEAQRKAQEEVEAEVRARELMEDRRQAREAGMAAWERELVGMAKRTSDRFYDQQGHSTTDLDRQHRRRDANLEYLKNVILVFLTTDSDDIKCRLVPVLSTVLQFTTPEVQTVYNAHRAWRPPPSGAMGTQPPPASANAIRVLKQFSLVP